MTVTRGGNEPGAGSAALPPTARGRCRAGRGPPRLSLRSLVPSRARPEAGRRRRAVGAGRRRGPTRVRGGRCDRQFLLLCRGVPSTRPTRVRAPCRPPGFAAGLSLEWVSPLLRVRVRGAVRGRLLSAQPRSEAAPPPAGRPPAPALASPVWKGL